MTALAEIQGHTFYPRALGPTSVVFDLGAASGGFALGVRELSGARCFAADASPSAFELLAEAPGVTGFNLALGGTDGRVRMDIGGHEGERYWARQGNDQGVADTDGAVEVEGITFAGFKRRAGVDFVDLVKLDIEGAEFDFFDAASDADLANVGQWSVEFHDFLDPSLAPKVAAVIRRMEGLGFATVVMTRHAHGDVLFLNRAHLGLDGWQLFCMRWPLKYGRGIRRMLRRGLGLGPGSGQGKEAA
ncbi:MAG: FkbM family methyltransferase [Rhodospirillaceae bacterium]